MKRIFAWIGLAIVFICLNGVQGGYDFPKVPRNFNADVFYYFEINARSWGADGKIWYRESKNFFRQDYANQMKEPVEFLQLSFYRKDFYLLTNSSNPTCSRNYADYPGSPYLFENSEKAIWMGKVDRPQQVLSLWRYESDNTIKLWYFNEKEDTLVAYIFTDLKLSKSMEFSNIVPSNSTQEFKIPSICA